VDATVGIQRGDLAATEAEAHVGPGVQLGADQEAGPRGRAERGVDALELVAQRDDGRVVDRHGGVDVLESLLEQVVQRLAVLVRPGLHDVADEHHR
jgi:hypothetical protein